MGDHREHPLPRAAAGPSLKCGITENTRCKPAAEPPLKWIITENTRSAAAAEDHREHPLEPPLGRRRWAVAAEVDPLHAAAGVGRRRPPPEVGITGNTRCMPPLGWVAAGRRRISG